MIVQSMFVVNHEEMVDILRHSDTDGGVGAVRCFLSGADMSETEVGSGRRRCTLEWCVKEDLGATDRTHLLG